MEIEGQYNTADIKSESGEEEALEQIREATNHKAFEGDGDIAIMPDFHWGKGATIGFTMPFKDKIVPGTVGVDIGCGMEATCYGNPGLDVSDNGVLQELDEAIRSRVPMGFNVHSRGDYHMHDDFPWDVCQEKLHTFNRSLGHGINTLQDDYGPEYYDDMLKRVGYDPGRCSNSVGTLGGGNHFIELGLDSEGRLWSVIHSGSRGIGAAIADYWMEKATGLTTARKNLDNVPEEISQYMTDRWKPKSDKIREDFEGEEIQRTFDKVSQAIQEYGPSTSDRNTDQDYLEGKETHGYIIDMIFAQTYADESRLEMATAVLNALQDVTGQEVFAEDGIKSVHNYIDFEDTTIRKGACRAHEGERVVIPFNMKYGTLICEGKGDPSWNNSAPHGAGRAMSRTEAKNRYDDEYMAGETEGVFMTKNPIDETPSAYKDPEVIEKAVGPTVEISDRIVPFMNLKAE